MVSEKEQSPIFLVRGANWVYEVSSNETNSYFDLETQAEEAATKAIEVFAGIVPKNARFELDDGEKEAKLGLVLEIFLLNSPKDKSWFFYSFIALANAGQYVSSVLSYDYLIEDYCIRARKDGMAKKELVYLLKTYGLSSGTFQIVADYERNTQAKLPKKKRKKDEGEV